MRMRGFVSALITAHLSLLTSSLAQVPLLFNYQGRMIDGTNLVNDVVAVRFLLYDAPTVGNLLYTELDSVTVVDGLYATTIGRCINIVSSVAVPDATSTASAAAITSRTCPVSSCT